MAVSQSIIWTTLPYGRVSLPSGKPALRVSIFVAPRLIPDATKKLNPFKLFLDWPKVVSQLKFKLVFEGGPSGDLTPAPGADPLDSNLWLALFDPNTFVRGAAFTDLQNTAIRSFPAATVLAYVQDLYGTTADKFGTDLVPHGPNDDTPLSGLKNGLGPLSDPKFRDRFDVIVDGMLKEDKVVKGKIKGIASDAQAAFLQASRFYRRKKYDKKDYRERPDPKFKPVLVKEPEFDFHQALAAFADYPRLMRRLGLVIDCTWPEVGTVPLSGRVRVDVTSADTTIKAAVDKDKKGWTAYSLEKTGPFFRARAAAGVESELTRGVLDLRLATDARPDAQKGPYLIAQLDVDGSALKTLHTAGSLVRLDDKKVTNYRSPKRSDLPALRTSGLSLYKPGRSIATHGQLIRAAKLQSDQNATPAATVPSYFADDLLRGYRVDVWDDVSKDWHPLCLRNGEYTLTKRNKQKLTLRDEGYVKGASAARGPAGETDIYQHERVVSFDGWSLVASRPGKTLAADPSETEPVPPPESAETEFGLETRFAPPAGTVPRLRVGRNYRLRVRLVDIAGNSLDFKEVDDKFASSTFHFSRYEPVPSPTLVPLAHFTEGESLERLVVRSDHDCTAAQYAADAAVNAALDKVRARLKLKDERAKGYAYAPANERHVAPPKTSQLEAELHGKFDEFIGPGKDHAKGFRLAAREKGTLLSKTIINLDTGAEEPIAGLDLELIPSMGAKPTDLDDDDRQPGDALGQGEYVLHKEKQLVIPFLPDPYAIAIAFVGLPGWAGASPKIVKLKGDWPNLVPFRIRLVERPGVLNQCSQAFGGAGEPKEIDEGDDGLVLEIYQPKGVVSEVRYSCILPEEGVKHMGLWKWIDQRGGLNDAAKKAILEGRNWLFTPWRTMTLVHAVQHPLCAPTLQVWEPYRAIGNTFATLGGRWLLSIKSTAKVQVQANWTEPLDDVIKPAPQTLVRSANVAELKMETSYTDQLSIPTETAIPALKGKTGVNHEFGDTKHRWIRYQLKGTTRFREYFPIEITRHDEAITRTGAEKLISIPSSARPVAPSPLYVIPTFRWEETALSNNGISRVRRGNGLRVYLDRPWWSSGDDERLGVIFRTGAVDDKDKPYVTQLGLDPVFDSTAPTTSPTFATFPLATDTAPSRSLEEKGNLSDVYSVAGHKVEYDPERRLWFSDIAVAAGSSYFPFIRLALARFQPYSIEDCHLSRVVLTDFVQLVPDRTLKMTWVSATKVRVQIYGAAPTETYVSSLLGTVIPLKTETQVKNATVPIADIFKTPATGAKTLEYFKADQVEFFRADKGLIDTGTITAVPAEAADASARYGLNEYSVNLEYLPDGASDDFGWSTIEVTPTKPNSTTGVAVATTATTAAKATTATSTKAATVKASTAKTAADIAITEAIDVSPVLTVKPLWEGDITLPSANNTRPRRLVIKEHELYFKATSNDGTRMPVARRLVYADMLNLPGPAA